MNSTNTPIPFGQLLTSALQDMQRFTRPTLGDDLEVSVDSQWSWGGPIDILEEDEEIVVTADLPGYSQDEITVSINGTTFILRATHETETGEDENHQTSMRRQNRSVKKG